MIKQKQIENLVADLLSKANANEVLKIANNLSDLGDVGQARTNLGVYSTSEVDAIVSGAQNARTVTDIAARGALTGLKVTDRVFVENDGDDKWAMYLVSSTTDGTGANSEFVKIADQDLFDNAMSASAIKTAYESNADTNAFTDAEKAKLAFITLTGNLDLDALATEVAGKQESFTETTESFSNRSAEADQNIVLTLAHSVKSGHQALVYINGVKLFASRVSIAAKDVTISAPHVIAEDDIIEVVYAY